MLHTRRAEKTALLVNFAQPAQIFLQFAKENYNIILEIDQDQCVRSLNYRIESWWARYISRCCLGAESLKQINFDVLTEDPPCVEEDFPTA